MLIDTDKDIYHHIGIAITTWQDVEDEHFKLFFKMLGTPSLDAASIAYFRIESFMSRHSMVTDLAVVALKDQPLASEWNGVDGLQKKLKDAGLDRNKLAHYGIQTEADWEEHPNGFYTNSDRERLRLQSSPLNAVNILQGKTPDKPAHNLGITEIFHLGLHWGGLALKLHGLQFRLPTPPQLEGFRLWFSQPSSSQRRHPRLPTKSRHTKPEPSSQ